MLRAAILLFALTSAPALAAGHYNAEPVNAPMEDRIILKNAVWKRSGGAYEAPQGSSRPAVICATFARKVGRLKSFSIGGKPVAEADLQKCNARSS